jgi:hypothetical protein
VNVWNEEETQFLNKLRKLPLERRKEELKARVQNELRAGLSSFIGKPSTNLAQKQIELFTQQVVEKYQDEALMLGFELKIDFSLNGGEFSSARS